MYVVDRKLDRRFKTLDEAISFIVDYYLKHYQDVDNYKVKKTPKGWSVGLPAIKNCFGTYWTRTHVIQKI